MPKKQKIDQSAPKHEAQAENAVQLKREQVIAKWNEDLEKTSGNVSGDTAIDKIAGPKLEIKENFTGSSETNRIEITVDENAGVTKELIQAVTLGSYIDKENMDRTVTGSTMGASDYFFMNVANQDSASATGGRDDDYHMLMFWARENAKKAIDAYKTGDRTQVEKYLQNLAEYARTKMLYHDITLNSESQVFTGLCNLLLKLRSTDAFKNIKLPDALWNKMIERVEIDKKQKEALQAEIKLVNDMPEADTDGRKGLVLQIITGKMLKQLHDKFAVAPVEEMNKSAINVIVSDEYFNKNVAPYFKGKKLFGKDIDPEKHREEWKKTFAFTGVVGGQAPLIAEANTFQTEKLLTDDSKKQYFERLKNVIVTTDAYKKMVSEKDPEKLRKLIEKFDMADLNVISETDGKKTERKFEIMDMAADEQEKKAITDRNKNIENACKNNHLKAYAEACMKCLDDTISLSITRNKEIYEAYKGEIIEQAINKYAIEEALDINTTFAYTKSRTAVQSLLMVCLDVKNSGGEVYVKNNKGGFIRFDVTIKENGIDIKAEKVQAVPYDKYDPVTEKHKNIVNAEAAKADGREEDAGYTECYRMVASYLKYISAATDGGKLQGLPAQFNQMFKSLKELSESLNKAYTAPGISPDEFNKLLSEHETCLKSIGSFLTINPFDRCALDLQEMLDRDIKLLKDVQSKTNALRDNSLKHVTIKKAVSAHNNHAELIPELKKPDKRWADKLNDSKRDAEQYIKMHAGSEPQMVDYPAGADRFNKVKIQVDEKAGITEDVIQIVTLGSFLDPAILGRGDHGEYSMDAADYMFMNVLQNHGNDREESYKMLLFEGRENAKKAIEDYKAGNREQFDKYVSNLASYLNGLGKTHWVTKQNEGLMFGALYKLAVRASELDIFKGKFDKTMINKLREKVEIGEQLKASDDAEKTFAEDIPPADSPERRKLLEKIIFGNVLDQMGKAFLEENVEILKNQKAVYDGMLTDAYYKANIEPIVKQFLTQDQIKENNLNKDKIWVSNLNQAIESIAQKVKFSEESFHTYLLSDPKRREAYYKKLRMMIAGSDNFKNLMKETNSEEIKKQLDAIKKDYTNLKTSVYTMSNGLVTKSLKELSLLDIPENAEQNKKFFEYQKNENKKIETHIQEIKDFSIWMLKSDLSTQKTRIITKNDKKQKKVLEDNLKNYIKKNGLELDLEKAVVSEFKKKLSEASQMAAISGEPIYLKNKGRGITKFIIKKGADNIVRVINHEEMTAFPYEKADYVSERRINRLNAQIAALDGRKARPEYCETYRLVNSTIRVMEAAGKNMAGKPQEYTALVEAMKAVSVGIHALYETQKKTDAERNIITKYVPVTDKMLDNFKKAAQEFNRCMEKYDAINPYDEVAKNLQKAVTADLVMLNRLFENNINIGTESLAEKMLAEREEKLMQADPELRKKADRYFENIYDSLKDKKDVEDYVSFLTGAIAKQYFYEKEGAGLVVDQNGNYNMHGADFLKTDGSRFTAEMYADFIKKNYDSIVSAAINRIPDFRKFKKDELADDKELKKFFDEINISYSLPDEMKREDRLRVSEAAFNRYRNFKIRCDIEGTIAAGGDRSGIPDVAFKFISAAGTKKERGTNKKLLAGLRSGDSEQIKAAYVELLEYFGKLDLKKFDPSKAEEIFNDPIMYSEMLDFVQRALEVHNIIKKAMANGVNIYETKYDDLRMKAAAIESLGDLWNNLNRQRLSANYDILDVDELKRLGADGLKKLIELTGNAGIKGFDMLGKDLGEISAEVNKEHDKYRVWTVKTEERRSFIECLEYAHHTLPASGSYDSMDEELLKFREKLVSNVRKTAGFVRDNSERYKKVIRAIDEYRMAGALDKEQKRMALETACGEYVQNRNSARTRTKIIASLGAFTHNNLAGQAQKYVHGARKAFAGKMMDRYIECICALPDGKTAREALSDRKFMEMTVDKMADTIACSRFIKNQDMIDNDVNKFTDLCFKAVNEVMRENMVYEVAGVQRKTHMKYLNNVDRDFSKKEVNEDEIDVVLNSSGNFGE